MNEREGDGPKIAREALPPQFQRQRNRITTDNPGALSSNSTFAP